MRVAVVGGGIVGLAVARQLVVSRPGVEVTLFEKESALATHQTGHNSGVLHAGVYYAPGSDKAVLCTRGRRLMVTFCGEHGVPVRTWGKVIVARDGTEEQRLGDLMDRAVANGVPGARLVDREELRELEPEITGVRAIHSPATGVVDFALVAARLATVVEDHGVTIRRGAAADRVRVTGTRVELWVDEEVRTVDAAIVCAGLQSDRLARSAGFDPSPAIVPFRGGWVQLARQHARRVRSLVYPVPDPRYPFLGVHFTRTIDDRVLAGPNALLALARERYDGYRVDLDDVVALLRWPGTWRMGARHWPAGLRELVLALSRRLYAREVSSYLPGVTADDLRPAGFGVRAQAVARTGAFVDDFAVDREGPLTVVRNAPSPAATSSLAIAERIVSVALGEQVEAPEAT